MNNLSYDLVSKVFSDVLSDVVSKTTGISITTTDEDAGLDELIGLMSLNGYNHGMVIISAGHATVKKLCNSMTGISIDEVTDNDIYDTLCELVNMTAGNAKLRFNSSEDIYSLSPPFIISGEDMSIITKNRVDFITRTLSGDGISLTLRVVFY